MIAAQETPVAVKLYESERATLWLGDARDVLPTLATESVDCVVTDPPYGVEWQAGTRASPLEMLVGDTPEDAPALLVAVTPDIARVTRRRRHVYTFGLPLRHPLLTTRTELVWDKDLLGAGDLSLVWGPSHERIYFHIRASQKTDNYRPNGGLAARLRRGSVIRVRRRNGVQVRRHPTEKPVELMRQLIESSSAFGELVLDPFAGVGSTIVAAILEGRRGVGVEIDAGYARTACERIDAAERIAALIAAA